MNKLHTLIAIAASLPTCLITQSTNAQFLRGFVRVRDILQPSRPGAVLSKLYLEDMDNDSDLDIVAVFLDHFTPKPGSFNDTSYFIEIFSNDSTGVFTSARLIDLNDGDGHQSSVAIADLNDDGLLDIIATNRPQVGSSSWEHEFAAILNLGNFEFFNNVYFPTEGSFSGIEIADFNDDGDQDVLIASSFDQLSLHFGNGSGVVFSPGNTILTGNGSTTGDSPSHLVVGDLNNDDHLDIVTNNFNSNDFSILYGRGGGLFWDGVLATIVPHGITFFRQLKLQDFNNDGQSDIVVSASGVDIRIFHNDYNGGAEPFPNFNSFETDIPGTSGTTGFAIEHIDCTFDSIPDLIIGNNRSRVFVGLGGENFSSTPLFSGPFESPFNGNSHIIVGDLDGDGDKDFINGNNSWGSGTTTGYTLYRNRCNELPCPADFDNDRRMNFFDVSAFLKAFASNDPSADFDDNGVINFFDVSLFLAAFQKGCPD